MASARTSLAGTYAKRDPEDIEGLKRLAIHVPEGGTIALGSIARIYEAGGPNTVNRENVRRRVVIQCNVKDRGVVDVVNDIQRAVQPTIRTLPIGYYLTYEGQFQSQRSASQAISALLQCPVGRVPGLVHLVSHGEPSPPSHGRAPYGLHWIGGGAGSDRSDHHNRCHGGLHLAS